MLGAEKAKMKDISPAILELKTPALPVLERKGINTGQDQEDFELQYVEPWFSSREWKG